MNQGMPWRKSHLAADYASQRQSGRRQNSNVLRPSIVRVHNIKSLGRQSTPQARNTACAEPCQFETFGARSLSKRTVGPTDDQLTMTSLPKAARQRQQQVLPAAKILAGVDVRDVENGVSLRLC
jgi:hypothetical protein